MSADIAVVICAHDEGRWNDLQDACASVDRQSLRAREVVVVVDHNDALLERVRRDLPSVIAVPNTHAPGLGGARNSGVAASSGSIVAFMDDDAVASPEWLALLAEQYSQEAVAGVGGSIVPMWPKIRPRWFPAEFDWLVGCTYRGMPETTEAVRNLIGCNMSFRRELLEALGGFRLGYGCDETELCIRLGQRWPDAKLLYVPQSSVFHRVPETRTGLRHFLSRAYFEGQSKAVVARVVGATDGLASEYRYTRVVLPAAVRRDLADVVRRGDVYGFARAGATVFGLAFTVAGYAEGRLRTAQAAKARGWEGDLP
jgi:GT2 family glycosyltransferase